MTARTAGAGKGLSDRWRVAADASESEVEIITADHVAILSRRKQERMGSRQRRLQGPPSAGQETRHSPAMWRQRPQHASIRNPVQAPFPATSGGRALILPSLIPPQIHPSSPSTGQQTWTNRFTKHALQHRRIGSFPRGLSPGKDALKAHEKLPVTRPGLTKSLPNRILSLQKSCDFCRENSRISRA